MDHKSIGLGSASNLYPKLDAENSVSWYTGAWVLRTFQLPEKHADFLWVVFFFVLVQFAL